MPKKLTATVKKETLTFTEEGVSIYVNGDLSIHTLNSSTLYNELERMLHYGYTITIGNRSIK